MKNLLLFYLLLFCSPAFCQENVYQDFETDSAAQSRGGMEYLNLYLQTNLRKPILAQSKGIGGRAVVSGIVEADGRITNVKATPGKFPELDREALRVFRLFNAWQPAQKGGKIVRQRVNIPVTFNPSEPFPYVNGSRISYYDADQKLLADSSELAKFKQVAPTDTTGLPNGDIVVFQRKRQDWKEYYRLPFTRRKSVPRSPLDKSVSTIGIQQANGQWQGWVVGVDKAGALVNQSFYANGERTGYELEYYPNGSVAQRTDHADALKALYSWYPNGQIKQIWTVAKNKPMDASSPDQITAFWDSTGRQLVNEGNGSVTYREPILSRNDTTRQTQFVEQGQYADGFKQGIWTGRYADGSYFYEERYEKGICQGGRAITAGSDTVRYAIREQQPEFTGGMQGLGQFLMQNLRYPTDAQRARAQGRVFISFVVCTDGTLCDYEVMKSAHPELDREAVRVVRAMSGHWKPGIQRGQKVRVKYNLPINFTL
jgi:TonB family protein